MASQSRDWYSNAIKITRLAQECNNRITNQLLPNNAYIVKFLHEGREECGDIYFLLKRQIKAITPFLLLSQETELLTSTHILLKSHKKVAQVQKTNLLSKEHNYLK